MFFKISLFFVFVSVSDCQCPARFEDPDFIEKFVVKEDPFKHINDQLFSDVWARNSYTKMTTCAFTKYLPQGDGSMLQQARYIHATGIEVVSGTELIKKTDKNGIFSVSGTYVDITSRISNSISVQCTAKKGYTGKMYVFYADENIVGYYTCEENGVNWNIAVQVKTENKADLLELEDNNVWTSMKNAMKTGAYMLLWPDIGISIWDFGIYDVKRC